MLVCNITVDMIVVEDILITLKLHLNGLTICENLDLVFTCFTTKAALQIEYVHFLKIKFCLTAINSKIV